MAHYRDFEWKIGNRKYGAAGSYEKDLDRLSASYYVTNFLKHLTARDLWKELEGYGRLVDVYIARKLSKQGKQFAARFSREIPKRSLDKTNTKDVGRKDNIPMHANKANGGSYANMVKGCTVDKQHEYQQSKIVLEVREYQYVEHSYRIALGEVNNATVIPQLMRMCYDEGFEEVKINYIGAYKKVASMYGKILFSDDELEEHRSSGKIYVCSKSKGPINETRIVVVAGEDSQVDKEDSDEEIDSLDTSENEEEVPINEVIPDSFKSGNEEPNKHEPEVTMEGNVEENDTRKYSDDSLMKKVHEQEKDQVGQKSENSNHTFPPGFNDQEFGVPENVVIVEGEVVGSDRICYLVNVYAPQDRIQKLELWDYITRCITNHEELQIGGRRFTKVDKYCTRMAKLDRFLMSNGLVDKFPNMVGTVLPRLWSDHCPILLKHETIDYGLVSFKLFNSCSLLESLSTLYFLKFPEISFKVLKLLKNSVKVLKIPENKLELMKIPKNKLESLKL
uniref:RNA-directed DNA polymerase, eukaryota n=1 Tax=Tanacetum cinerariifolium TaxID=118510 RepID=A0A6L2MMV6_TANCI|nr:RNA-directed DNA polymerase, eukaryota [Tanacetum cinerariifolium]